MPVFILINERTNERTSQRSRVQEGETFTVPSFVCCHRRQNPNINREEQCVWVYVYLPLVEKLNVMFVFLFFFFLFTLNSASFSFILEMTENENFHSSKCVSVCSYTIRKLAANLDAWSRCFFFSVQHSIKWRIHLYRKHIAEPSVYSLFIHSATFHFSYFLIKISSPLKSRSDFRCARHVLKTMKFHRKIFVYLDAGKGEL